MEPSSHKLEIWISLTKEQALHLENNSLEGMLEFKNGVLDKKIPYELKHYRMNKDRIQVIGDPLGPLGYAKRFSITIYNLHYQYLINFGSCSDIFHGICKINIYVRDIKNL